MTNLNKEESMQLIQEENTVESWQSTEEDLAQVRSGEVTVRGLSEDGVITTLTVPMFIVGTPSSEDDRDIVRVKAYHEGVRFDLPISISKTEELATQGREDLITVRGMDPDGVFADVLIPEDMELFNFTDEEIAQEHQLRKLHKKPKSKLSVAKLFDFFRNKG